MASTVKPVLSARERLADRIQSYLLTLKKEGLQRSLRPPQGIDLCSNDYLALSSHAEIKERMAAAVLSEGCGSTASRLLRGERTAFHNIERRFAHFKNCEASLYFSSGYNANVGTLSTILAQGDVVFSDELNHASLIDGIRLSSAQRIIFPHCDLKSLKKLLSETPCAGEKFLVTESLFSMDGDEAPLAKYAELCSTYNTHLIVDEAHAVGIFGATGSGLIEEANIQSETLCSLNMAGKALGVSGAFVAGPQWLIDFLIQRARSFIFSTAPPPAVAAAIDAALDIIEREPQRRAKLLTISKSLRQALSNCFSENSLINKNSLVNENSLINDSLNDSSNNSNNNSNNNLNNNLVSNPTYNSANNLINNSIDISTKNLVNNTCALSDGRSQIIPIIVGENERAVRLAEIMVQAGFDVRAIRPPTVPVGSARLRISVNINLDQATMDRFVATLKRAWQQLN